jgi:hypothetical protein
MTYENYQLSGWLSELVTTGYNIASTVADEREAERESAWHSSVSASSSQQGSDPLRRLDLNGDKGGGSVFGKIAVISASLLATLLIFK